MTVNNSITSGTIAIEDGTKAKEEFAPARKVKVELSFSVPEGQDGSAYMHGVARIAEAKVASMLGRAAPAETTLAVTVTATAPPATPAKPETAAAKKKREAAEAAAIEAAKPQKTKADLAAEKGLPITDTQHKSTAATDDELLAEDEPEITAAGKIVEPEDELGDLLGDTAPVPITDTELGKAAQDKNAKMKAEHAEKWAPAKIRDLITKFAGVGKRINDIPAANRPKFLMELGSLAA